MYVEDSVKFGIPKDIDHNYPVSFIRGGQIISKESIDWHGIALIKRSREVV